MTDIDPLLYRTRPLAPPTVPVRAAVPPQRRRHRHPAVGARIAAAGIGTTTMLGLVASMGFAAASVESAPAPTPPISAATPPTPLAPALSVPATTAPIVPTTGATAPAVEAPVPSATPAPVVLTARPDVRVITAPAPAAAPAAPAATTRGSG